MPANKPLAPDLAALLAATERNWLTLQPELAATRRRLDEAWGGCSSPPCGPRSRRRRRCGHGPSRPSPLVAVRIAGTPRCLTLALMSPTADWRGLLTANVAQARQILRKILDGPLQMTPLKDGSGVRLTGRANYGKVVQLGWRPRRDSNPCFGLERATS